MTKDKIAERLRICIGNAFGRYSGEVGEDEGKDVKMFFSGEYFNIVLHDGRLCDTNCKAKDFDGIRFRQKDEFTEPYVAIYLKNGDTLYYYGHEQADCRKAAWILNREGRPPMNDDALIDLFKAEWEARQQYLNGSHRQLVKICRYVETINKEEHDADQMQKTLAEIQRYITLLSVPEDMNVVEYEEVYAEKVKDLLVELQAYLVSLDDRGVIVLKENYREDYFAYLMGEIEKHEGKMFLARDGQDVVGLVVCKIFQGGGEQDITTSCPKIGFISDLIVTEKYRRKRIGSMLIVIAEAYFGKHDCAYTQLEVFAPNAKARRFYKKLGFEENCLYLSKKTAF